MHKICLFDLNGTLVDTKRLDPFFADTFGSADYRKIWLETLLHETLVLTVTDMYTDFADLAEAVLEAIATDHGVKLTADQLDQFEFALNSLPIFPDVLPALARLKAAGYRLAVLSNSSETSAADLLSFDDALSMFDQILSTDTVRRFKPALEPYHMAADELGVAPHQIWMIAAHAWDITGAVRAGLKTALILRSGHGLTRFDKRPDVQGVSLLEVTEALIHKDEGLMAHVRDWL